MKEVKTRGAKITSINGVLQTDFSLCSVFGLSEETHDKLERNVLKLKMINFNMGMMLDKILVNISKPCAKDTHYTTPVL